MRKQLEKQLRCDVELGVIECIEGPTPWVSPIVAAPKPKSPSKIRVWVDMLQASRAIKEMNGDLNSAKVFSKMDLNQGYNQLVLAPASKYVTTSSNHMDLMPYKRLNFIVLSTA